MPQYFTKTLTIALALLGAIFLSSCLHTIQETTCKSKFKKKYNCPFSKIEIVEDDLAMGNLIQLRGCGKRATYDGTEEVDLGQ